MFGSVMELTESGREPVVVRAVLDAEGLWFLLSHSVDVDEADDEVADMIGSRSLLAELGRVLPGTVAVFDAPPGTVATPQPFPINSLFTLLGRVPVEILRCSDGSCSVLLKLNAGSPDRRARLSAFGELAEGIGSLLCRSNSASCDEVIGLKPICGLERSSVDFRATKTGGETPSAEELEELPRFEGARGEVEEAVVPAVPIEVVESFLELAGFISA